MLAVIRWVLASVNQEPFGRKPYNPVLVRAAALYPNAAQYVPLLPLPPTDGRAALYPTQPVVSHTVP